MHVEAKVLLVFFECNVGSCDFNVLLVLLLPILAGVRHAKAKGLLILFGCNVGSCHVCPCSKHVTCDGAVTNNVTACVMHVEARALLVFFGCNVRSCDFNVLLVLLLPILAGVKHAKVKAMLILFGCMLGHVTHARAVSM
jgi:hypothetical protein